jgi:hypothetical protein
MGKIKLTVNKQIEHMKKENGIKFTIITENDSKEFLTFNNYYFKIKAYAKNYDKYTDVNNENYSKYINLEFAYLVELSTIDSLLRKDIIKMTLDVEHFLKVKMLTHFSTNSAEDGYNIVNKFLQCYPNVEENIVAKGKNSVCKDMIDKLKDDWALWNIVEVLSFGEFISLYQLYFSYYQEENSVSNELMPIKFIRNAAAHNNCLINSLKIPCKADFSPNLKVTNAISRIPGIKAGSREKKMKNPVIHDFIALLYVLLYVLCQICSAKTVKHTFEELEILFTERMTKHGDYFSKNQNIISSYEFVKKIIDYYNKNSI